MRRANAEVSEVLYVEILYPGILFCETSEKKVKEVAPEKFAKTLPPSAFGFRYFNRTMANIKGEGEAELKKKFISGTYYIGKKMNLAEVKALKPAKNYEILISNMEINKIKHVVRCRTGNFQSLDKGDKVIELKEKKNGKAA